MFHRKWYLAHKTTLSYNKLPVKIISKRNEKIQTNSQDEATLARESTIQCLSLVLGSALLLNLPETGEALGADVQTAQVLGVSMRSENPNRPVRMGRQGWMAKHIKEGKGRTTTDRLTQARSYSRLHQCCRPPARRHLLSRA